MISKKLSRYIFIGAVLILIVVIGVSSNHTGFRQLPRMVGNVVAPVQKVFYSVSQTFSSSFDSLLNISRIREENEQLRDRVKKLQEENLHLKMVVNQSEVLKTEFEALSNLEHDYLRAQIISRDPNNWFQRFTIDKGSKDGLKRDDIVIQAVQRDNGFVTVGLVGKVVEVGHNWSRIITVNDLSSSVSIKVLRTREGGVAKGTMSGQIEAFMFVQTEDLKLGDEIMTSGLGEIYVPNLLIGHIANIEKTADLLTEKIIIEPIVDFEKLYHVYVIRVDR